MTDPGESWRVTACTVMNRVRANRSTREEDWTVI